MSSLSVRASDLECRLLELAGHNHFTILDDLAAPAGAIWKLIEECFETARRLAATIVGVVGDFKQSVER
jgi:hypothetical protein